MLLKKDVLDGIVEGRITLAFRRWQRPTVKSGGSLRTRIGVLAIESVEVVHRAKITKQDALHAGYETRAALLAELDGRSGGQLYRIALRYQGRDPRLALREQSQLDDEEVAELAQRLERMDSRSSRGPWTQLTMQLIEAHPGRRAPELAELAGAETKPFKANVRKLKELGLTESLQVGYRLSPRGQTLLTRMGE